MGFKCVAEEHRAHKSETETCGDLQYLTDLVVKNQPVTLSAITNKTVEEVENVLRKNHQFVNDFYSKMVDKQSACTSAAQASNDIHAQCEADKESIEMFYCSMKYGRDQSCVEYDACYDEQVVSFEKTVAETKELEAHTKEQFQKLTCFERGISDEGSAESSMSCDPSALSTAHLSVTYPMKPQPKGCMKLTGSRRDHSMVQCKEGKVAPKKEETEVAESVESNSSAGVNTSAL